jgi:hypothetical protein
MAAGPWILYGNAIEKIADSTIQLELGSNNARVILVRNTYTPNTSTHTAYSDVSTPEVTTGGGYTAGGAAITITVTRSGVTTTVTSGNVSWASSTITAKYAAIVMDADANGTLAAGDLLLCYCLLEAGGADVSTTNGTFAVNMNASGIFTIA